MQRGMHIVWKIIQSSTFYNVQCIVQKSFLPRFYFSKDGDKAIYVEEYSADSKILNFDEFLFPSIGSPFEIRQKLPS